MKKNDRIYLEITGMTAEGSGVGRVDGMAVFVPMTAPGDKLFAHIVKVKKNYAFGIVDQLTEPSPDRTEPDCTAFRQCGGCVYRHIRYEKECQIKQDRVSDAMRRIGGIDLAPQPILSAVQPERYRNKAQFPIAPDGSVGFFAVHSHRIIPCADCMLQPEAFTKAAAAVSGWIAENGVSTYDEATGKGLLRHLYLRRAANGDVMVVPVINGERIPAQQALLSALREALGERLKSVQLNVNTEQTNVILGKRCILLDGEPYLTDTLCGIRVRLSPLSFYQVNRDMAEMLYRKAAEYADCAGKNVLDLYCGAGTIGLSMAADARSVTGVEIVPEAIEDAKANAAENGITNARFFCGDAKDAAARLAGEGWKPDVVIVDPPRKGCAPELLHTVAEDFRPERLVYVSCDPATLARDVALLAPLGYRLTAYTPVDLFPRTAHVETAALLLREPEYKPETV